MRTQLTIALLLLVPGCPWCETDFELGVVEGTTTLQPGERVTLELDSEGYHAGPDRCRGHWYVDGIEGGSLDVGIVTRCGVYIANATQPGPSKVIVEATQHPLDGCADCCPYGRKTITLAAAAP
jgi:hypothetical protein